MKKFLYVFSFNILLICLSLLISSSIIWNNVRNNPIYTEKEKKHEISYLAADSLIQYEIEPDTEYYYKVKSKITKEAAEFPYIKVSINNDTIGIFKEAK
jgi:hypothetical protein